MWQPSSITEHIRTLQTSLGTAEVETDAGRAYFKPLDNPEGPHALASEWVGTKLAAWLGLPTFEVSLVMYDQVAKVKNKAGGQVGLGVGIVLKAETGFTVSSGSPLLNKLEAEGPANLVVFDTWIRNRDRCSPSGVVNYGNLFLSNSRAPRGHYRLVAMDHTHCFADQCEITSRIREDRFVLDPRVFGLFPEFIPFVRRADLRPVCQRLKELPGRTVDVILEELPPEWEVNYALKGAWKDMILRRAGFVAETIIQRLEEEIPRRLAIENNIKVNS